MRKLKRYRSFANLTQSELGELVGLAESTISSYEQEDGQYPKLDVAVKIRDEIQRRMDNNMSQKISVEYLFGLSEFLAPYK